MSNLQDALSRLSQFWSAQGCSEIWPCSFEIPASTLHPELFLRLVKNEPSRVYCRQPISRPLDGRGALHANRLARHLQLSVLLKPPPENVIELVLRCLRALGFDLEARDVRFAEWNWAVHSLDAWGVGWRIEIDGLGIARITYIQETASQPLQPVALEVCFGIERLMQALLGAKSVLTLPWDEHGASYAAQRREEEIELSRYAQEIADPEALWQIFESLRREAIRCLKAGAGRRAYELAIQGLLWIDRLEARHQLQLAERRQGIESLRQLIVAAADVWLRGRSPEDLPAIGPSHGMPTLLASRAPEPEGTATETTETEAEITASVPGKRTSAKRTPAKRTSKKRTPAKRTPAKRTPAKRKSAKDASDEALPKAAETSSRGGSKNRSAKRPSPPKRKPKRAAEKPAANQREAEEQDG